jgi:hypothetical protein
MLTATLLPPNRPERERERRILIARLVGGGLCFVWLAIVLIVQPSLPGRTLVVWDGRQGSGEVIVVQPPAADTPTPVVQTAAPDAEGVAPVAALVTPVAEPVAPVVEPALSVAEEPLPVVEQAPSEPDVTVMPDRPAWRRVRAPDGTVGWMADDLLEEIGDEWVVQTDGPVAMLRTEPTVSAPAARALGDRTRVTLAP